MKIQFYTYLWEKGIFRKENEDSLYLRSIHTSKGELALACLCDGIGGVGNGEVASGYITEKMDIFLMETLLPAVRRNGCNSRVICSIGMRYLKHCNEELLYFSRKSGRKLGSTASMLILFEHKFFVFHIGDSRIYKIGKRMKQLTKDHSMGNHVLTRCVGMNAEGMADCKWGYIGKECGFLLCSDGFYQKNQKSEMKQVFNRKSMELKSQMPGRLREMEIRSRKRGETDNSSALFLVVENHSRWF